MLTQAQRAAILQLHAQKVPKREIARLLGISRPSVRQVLQANSIAVPKIERAEKAAPFRSQMIHHDTKAVLENNISTTECFGLSWRDARRSRSTPAIQSISPHSG